VHFGIGQVPQHFLDAPIFPGLGGETPHLFGETSEGFIQFGGASIKSLKLSGQRPLLHFFNVGFDHERLPGGKNAGFILNPTMEQKRKQLHILRIGFAAYRLHPIKAAKLRE
jgi:hypothetical protein